LKKIISFFKSIIILTVLSLPGGVLALENGLIEERCYEKELFGKTDIWASIASNEEMLETIDENKKFLSEFTHAIKSANPVTAKIKGLRVFPIQSENRFFLSSDLKSALKPIYKEEMYSQNKKSWWISQIMNLYEIASKLDISEDDQELLEHLKDEIRSMSKMYKQAKIEKFSELKNEFFFGYIKTEMLQDTYILCSYRFFENFNADFQLSVPEDLSFILEIGDTQALEIDDQILGARLSGSGNYSSVKSCITPGVLTSKCNIIPLNFDNSVLLILLKKLTVKQRYQLSKAKNIDFSSCIISEIQNPRNIGGPQVIGFLKDLSKEFQSAAIDGVNVAKSSETLEEGIGKAITQTFLGITKIILRPDTKLENINVLTCELEFQNLNIIN